MHLSRLVMCQVVPSVYNGITPRVRFLGVVLSLAVACDASPAPLDATIPRDATLTPRAVADSGAPDAASDEDAAVPEPCASLEASEPYPDASTGLSRCDDRNLFVRTGTSRCAVNLPTFVPMDLSNWEGQGIVLACESNDDCTERPRGFCEWDVASQMPATRCTYACASDDDCPGGGACDCGPDFGRCVRAFCTGPDECDSPCFRIAESSVCTDWNSGDSVYYDCQGPNDTCNSNDDCEIGQVCSSYHDAASPLGSPTDARNCREPGLCGI